MKTVRAAAPPAKRKVRVDAAAAFASSRPTAAAVDDGVDDEDAHRSRWQAFKDNVRGAQVSTKRTAQSAAWLTPFGVEVAVKVNHVDPLNSGSNDVKLNWITTSDGSAVDIENTIRRGEWRGGRRWEWQGPAVHGRADGAEGLPLRARAGGFAVSQEIKGRAIGDLDPQRAELKVEVKITDRSVAMLAALAGQSQTVSDLGTKFADTAVADVVGNVLVGAVPVVGTAIAAASARRAFLVGKDKGSMKADKAFAVARAIADALCIVQPVWAIAMHLGLVGVAAGMAFVDRRRGRRAPDEGDGEGGAGP